MAASTSLDKTVRLWGVSEVETGCEAEGNWVGTSVHELLFLQINENSFQRLKVLNAHKRYVTTCAFSLDGKLLASGM